MDKHENFYKKMLDNLHDGVYFVDKDRKICFWNKGAERITGYSEDEVLNSYCHMNLLNHVDDSGTQLCLKGCPLEHTMVDGIERAVEVYLHHKQGHRVPVFVRTMPIYEEGIITGCVEIFRDNTERLKTISQMQYLETVAMTDPLTGVANRRYVETFIDSKLMELKNLGIPFSVAFLDVDDFKKVNDTFGHDVGDEILKTLTATVLNTLRKTDLIGRWGGEEFVAVLVGVDEKETAMVLEKIRFLIEASRTKTQDGDWVNVTVSIGGAIAHANSETEALITEADDKMYTSKQNGKNQITM